MKQNTQVVYTSLAVITVCLFLLSCSTNSPISGPIHNNTELSGSSVSYESANHPKLWGYWEVQIDPVTAAVEILPLRSSQFTVDVVTFLQPPAGSLSNLGIQVTDVSNWMSEGLITVDVRLTHPFPGMHQFTGHDVKGVFITPGNLTAGSDNTMIYTDGVDQPVLLNADGYTRWQNPVEFTEDGTIFTYTPGALGTPDNFTATINGYKYFVDNIEPDDDVAEFFTDAANVTNRGQFGAGSSIHRTYELKFPMIDESPTLIFQYAVTAHWVQPVDLDPYNIPGSFPPDANAAEAIHLSVTDNSDLWYHDGESGGSLKLEMEIFHWAPCLVGGEALDYVNSILIDCSDGDVQLEDFVFTQDMLPTPSPGCGNSSVIEIELVDLNLVSTDPITVISSIVADDGEGYVVDLDPGNGAIYSSSPLASYFFTNIMVAEAPPVTLTVTDIEPDHAYQHETIDTIITGTDFIDVTSVRLEMNTEIIEAIGYTVDSATQISAEFDLTGYPFGLYDVVVEVNGGYTGVLEDGFEILLACGTEAHDLDGTYTLDTYIEPYFFTTVLTAGPYAGYSCTRNNADKYMYVYDHNTQADNTEVTKWFYQNGGRHLDAANDNGLMIIIGLQNPLHGSFGVRDQTSGAEIQVVSSGRLITVCGDFDGNDDFWMIVDERPIPDNTNWYSYYLQHYEYDSTSPNTPYSMVDEWEITDLFADTNGEMRYETFGDIVILPDSSAMYVLTGYSGSGEDSHMVDKLDLTGDEPVIIGTWVIPDSLDTEQQVDSAHSRCVKIDLDYSDDDYTHCRLVIAGSRLLSCDPIDWRFHVYRLDTDLNLLGESETPFALQSCSEKWYGITLDLENHCLSLLESMWWGEPKTYYGYCEIPSDW